MGTDVFQISFYFFFDSLQATEYLSFSQSFTAERTQKQAIFVSTCTVLGFIPLGVLSKFLRPCLLQTFMKAMAALIFF
jgi:hypothetical protein